MGGHPPCTDFLISTSPHATFSRSSPDGQSVQVGSCPLMSLPTLWGDTHPRLPTSIVTFTSLLLENVSELAQSEPGTAEPDLRRREESGSGHLGTEPFPANTAVCWGRAPALHRSAESRVPFPSDPLPETWKAMCPLLRVTLEAVNRCQWV